MEDIGTKKINAINNILEEYILPSIWRYHKGYYLDRKNRIWKGYIESEDNFHYAYADGELDPDDKVIWILARSARGNDWKTISESTAIIHLLTHIWPNLTTEGWEDDIAKDIVDQILYNQSIAS